MKKSILSLMLLLVGIGAQAQDWRFGVQINGSKNDVPGAASKGVGAGYGFGAFAEYQLSKHFFVDGGVEFVKTQTEFDFYTNKSNAYVYESRRFRPAFLHVPFHVGYRLPIAKGFGVSLSAGPYVGVGLFGGSYKTHMAWSGKDITVPKDYPLGKKEDIKNAFNEGMKRFDWGLDFRFGVEVGKHWRVGASYRLGLQKVINLDAAKGEPSGYGKNRIFSVQVGYTF